jgi:sugar lactone lactonase YvrE
MPGAKSLRVGDPICIAATGDKCGEGILWEMVTQSIYWTDINRFLVHRYRLEDAELKTWFFSEPVTCVLSTNRRDTLALVLGSGVALWEPERDIRYERLFSLPGWPVVRCNDAGVDPCGVLWVGSMRNNVKENGEPSEAGGRDGVLYRVDGAGGWSERRRDLGISNTLLWSSDCSRFYFGDSLRNEIWTYNYDGVDGSIRDEKSFFRAFERGLPDGSALDVDGYLWNCRYGGGCIVRISPDGRVDRVIEMPVANPTNCTFGGKDSSSLLVTCASPVPGQWERFGGCLFAIETNVAGPPSNAFNCF